MFCITVPFSNNSVPAERRGAVNGLGLSSALFLVIPISFPFLISNSSDDQRCLSIKFVHVLLYSSFRFLRCSSLLCFSCSRVFLISFISVVSCADVCWFVVCVVGVAASCVCCWCRLDLHCLCSCVCRLRLPGHDDATTPQQTIHRWLI